MRGERKITVGFFSPVTDKMADDLEPEDTCLRDSISIASTDSFVSAAEVRINHRAVNQKKTTYLTIRHRLLQSKIQLITFDATISNTI